MVINSGPASNKRFPREIFSRGQKNKIAFCHRPSIILSKNNVLNIQGYLPTPTNIANSRCRDCTLHATKTEDNSNKKAIVVLKKMPSRLIERSYLPRIILPSHENPKLKKTESIPEPIIANFLQNDDFHTFQNTELPEIERNYTENSNEYEESKNMQNYSSNHDTMQIQNLALTIKQKIFPENTEETVEDTPRFKNSKSRASLQGLLGNYSEIPIKAEYKQKSESVKTIGRNPQPISSATIRKILSQKEIPNRSKSKNMQANNNKISIKSGFIIRGSSQEKNKQNALLEFEDELKKHQQNNAVNDEFIYTSIPWKNEEADGLFNLTFGEKGSRNKKHTITPSVDFNSKYTIFSK